MIETSKKSVSPSFIVLTPSQGEGPFYPVIPRHEWPHTDKLHLSAKLPPHERLSLRIRLTSFQLPSGIPFRVEVWHASREGRYRHPRDPDWIRLWDPEFLGFACQELETGSSVEFQTCMPGVYWDEPDGPRPRHLHLKLRDEEGTDLFTTQIYFEGDRLNSHERSLERLPPEERRRLCVQTEWDVTLQTWVAEFRIRVENRLHGFGQGST